MDRANTRVLAVDSGLAYAVSEGLSALSIEDGERRWALDTDPEVAVPANRGLFMLTSSSPQDVSLSLYQ